MEWSEVLVKCYFENGKMYVKDGETIELLKERGYGFEVNGGMLELDIVEVLYLHRMNKAKILSPDSGKELQPPEVLQKTGFSQDKFLSYLVYLDLRNRGRVVRMGPKPMMRLFPRGYIDEKSYSRHLVYVVSEDKPMSISEFTEAVKRAMALRKVLLMGIIDDEGIISYYVSRLIDLPTIREVSLNFKPVKAYLTFDRLIVWDIEDSQSIYAEGYFGHPIGIRKPKTKKFDSPSQLSLYEANYLLQKNKLEVYDQETGKKLSHEEFITKVSRYRERFHERCVTYNYWRDKGFIVKAGSKFGVDFIIYRYGPGIDHAPFMCHVFSEDSVFTPIELIRAGRVATTVKKRFIISTVKRDGKIENYKFTWFRP